MFHEIDTALLITLVENHPVIWDNTTEYYKFKLAHAMAWKKICGNLHDGYNGLSDGEKRDFGKQAAHRWANIRDQWIRCHKKLIDYKVDGGEKVFKYKYYERMKFLAKIVTHRAKELNVASFDESSDNSEEHEILRNKNKKNNVSMTKEERRIMYFFKSIAPTVQKYNDNDLFEFQFEVVRSMKEISQRFRPSCIVEQTSPMDSPQSEMNDDVELIEDQKHIIVIEDGD